jgi:hypothetical protein
MLKLLNHPQRQLIRLKEQLNYLGEHFNHLKEQLNHLFMNSFIIHRNSPVNRERNTKGFFIFFKAVSEAGKSTTDRAVLYLAKLFA